MALPFSVAQFYGIFSAYNQAMWPAQWVLNALAVAAVAAIVLRTPLADRIAAGILALFWLWTGLAYHAAFFTAINPLAWGFAALAVAGGLAFLWQGVLRGRLVFALAPGWRALTASALIAFALVVYPAWSVFAGHRSPELPTFGLPCPTP